MPKVLKVTKSKTNPKAKAKINSQFPRDKTKRHSRPKKTKGIVIRLASRIKAMVKRTNAKTFIGN
jgi:hypothetical protein